MTFCAKNTFPNSYERRIKKGLFSNQKKGVMGYGISFVPVKRSYEENRIDKFTLIRQNMTLC
jgi:hypothetical protein